ncbi:hypothetical protein ACL1BX_09770, partial [Corynebacterium striatum]
TQHQRIVVPPTSTMKENPLQYRVRGTPVPTTRTRGTNYPKSTDYSQHSREKLQKAINLGASAYCVVTREARSGHGGLKISCCFEINGVAVGTMPEPDMQRNLERLSAIQLRVLNGIICGHSNYGIAEETHLSVPMIKKIVSQLLDIFAAENRVQLALKTLPAMG